MKIKNYITTIITFVVIGIIAYFIANSLEEWDTGFWFVITGSLSTFAFIVYMAYNPAYSDASKPNRVMSGWKMVENANKNTFDHGKSSGDVFADRMGYGVNPPNLAGLALGILFILISTIL